MVNETGRRRPEKVCLFIDNNALSAALSGRKVNYQRLREWLVGHREAAISRVYCGEVPNDERSAFYDYLRRHGYDVVPLRNPQSRSHVGSDDPDLGCAISSSIAWEMCELLSMGHYSTFILVAGGFEFASIVSRVRERGTEVEVVFPSESCSSVLKKRATEFRPFQMECLAHERNKRTVT